MTLALSTKQALLVLLQMSLTRQFLREFRPLFRMLEEPLTRSPSYYGLPSRSVFDDPFFHSPATVRPSVDVTEEGNSYVVEAELPGVKKENVEVRVGDAGRSVTIEGRITNRRSGPEVTSAQETNPSEGVVEGVSSLWSLHLWLALH